MKRQTIFLAVFVLAVLAMVALIVSKQTNVVKELSVKPIASETDSLLGANNPAINSASAQVNASIPAISVSDELVLGDKKAPLSLVVYEDLTSAYSSNYNDILKKALAEFPDKLAVYVRPYFESDNSLALLYQTAAVCAGEEGKFSEMRSFIFEQKPLNPEALVDGAKKLSLNGKQFSNCLNNSAKQAKIARAVEDIRMIAVFGAPTSILDGEIITGARLMDDTKNGEGENIEGLRSIITRHLAGK